MNHNLKVSKSIIIDSNVEQLWEALTDPEIIKEYLFGTETITDWKIGSSIIFQGEYDGHQYVDKGIVIEYRKNELLQYNYWSGFSGLEDIPENYAIITYSINENSYNQLNFTWTQEGFANEQGLQHSEQMLDGMLNQIKRIVEQH